MLLSRSEKSIINNCIEELLEAGHVSTCSPCDGQFLSPIFSVPKPNGKHRFILNLKALNKFVDVEHFKMEDYWTAIKLLKKDDYMASIDLKIHTFWFQLTNNIVNGFALNGIILNTNLTYFRLACVRHH